MTIHLPSLPGRIFESKLLAGDLNIIRKNRNDDTALIVHYFLHLYVHLMTFWLRLALRGPLLTIC